MSRFMLCALCVVSLCWGIAWGQPADFGDLADPGFPTTRNSSSATVAGRVGPYHLSANHEWIGETAGTTTLEPAAKLIDADEDDGPPEIFELYQDGVFTQLAQVVVSVTTDGDPAIRYLNIAADLNNDGVFQSYPVGMGLQYEWLACNVPILFQDETKAVVSTFTLLSPLSLLPCVRVTLTTTPIAPELFGTNGWDGSGPAGGFDRGETEDWCGGVIVLSKDLPKWEDIHTPPPIMPKPPFPPGLPPKPKTRVVERPGAKQPPLREAPEHPEGEKPRPPITTEPPRFDQPDPFPLERQDAGSVLNMPDIKQGENECAPTAAANSIRYLMDKAGLTPAGDDDAINRGLQGKLKEAMGTTASGGTTISPDNPDGDNFLKGKAKADLPAGVGERLTTQANSNPSFDDICKAVQAGKDVEVVIATYDWNAPTGPSVKGHMVTIVGCIKHPNGTWELKYHDPEDKHPLDEAGDTVYPPNIHSMLVRNGAGDSTKGGLEVLLGPETPGSEYIKPRFIEHIYIEELAEEGDLGATADTDNANSQLLEPVTLQANVPAKADNYGYQWIHDGVDIPWGTEATYVIPQLVSEAEGSYTCFVYDWDGTFQYTNAVLVSIHDDDGMPASGKAALVLVMLALCFLAGRVLVWGRAQR